MNCAVPDIVVFEETEEPVSVHVSEQGPEGPPGLSRFLEAEDVTDEGLVHGAVFVWDQDSGLLRPANMTISPEVLRPLTEPLPRISGETLLSICSLNAVAIEMERRMAMLAGLLGNAFRPLARKDTPQE